MTAQELRQKYLDFFKSKNHAVIPSASLIPENDPSVLFTTAGMHPLVPYLLGEKHPEGKRLVNVQKCIRTGDIDEVGDNRHLTFFEMLGNWSLGDYFKKESIEWSFEFLTDKKTGLGLDPARIYVTVFRGEDGIPRDDEAIEIWRKTFKKAGITAEVSDDGMIRGNIRIIPSGKEDNFWIAGETGPCGPDTEMYYDTRPKEGQINDSFEKLVNSFRLIEIWNDVFMEFRKTPDKKYEKLSQQNVDTGMGLERTLAVVSGKESVFDTEIFEPLLRKIAELSNTTYESRTASFRIIADHLKAATFIMADDKGIRPSNLGQGYVARRLIRRALRHGKKLGIKQELWTKEIAKVVAFEYRNAYTELPRNIEKVIAGLDEEEGKFQKTLEKGLREFDKLASLGKNISGTEAFNLYQTYGFPLEITQELAEERGLSVDEENFKKELREHQKRSRTATAGMFRGGLASTSEKAIKLHTAAHLLLASLRKVLGDHVMQKGSNITNERLRFDFSYAEKMTESQKDEVERLVNEAISRDFTVKCEEMILQEAINQGAIGVFKEKYAERVKVYTIFEPNFEEIFSKEICGGPHVEKTGVLGNFKIVKEESSSAGVRRIKAILE